MGLSSRHICTTATFPPGERSAVFYPNFSFLDIDLRIPPPIHMPSWGQGVRSDKEAGGIRGIRTPRARESAPALRQHENMWLQGREPNPVWKILASILGATYPLSVAFSFPEWARKRSERCFIRIEPRGQSGSYPKPARFSFCHCVWEKE